METLEVNVSCEVFRFWNAIKIYYQQPKAINKQVLFSEHVLTFQFHSSLSLIKSQEVFDIICCKFSGEWTAKDCIRSSELSNFGATEMNDVEQVFLLPSGMYMLTRKLIPKINKDDNFEFFEFIFLDKFNGKTYFFTKSLVKNLIGTVQPKEQDVFAVLKFSFLQIIWDEKNFVIFYNKDLGGKGITWIRTTFAPKFKKLLLNVDLDKTKNKSFHFLQFDNKVNIVQYYKFYEKMKSKYAKYFVENWTENTDPKKFVYEDVGIATYLLMLWNGGNTPEEDSKKQKFIDLGCGNGLLVHILNSEGHLGIGLDMRRRKIWDIYPTTTVLQEKVVNPTSETTYPDADWLIGNHSDELTVWIPIMARLSNSQCQYFVLPCCPYQLNGTKFQRKNSGLSSYQDFIIYVKQISEMCQFQTYVDKLRIPSTKRICLIGLNKSEIFEKIYTSLKKDIIKFIEQECQSCNQKDNDKSENQSSINFKVRELVEPVRNCTKVPPEYIDNVLKIVMRELLKGQNVYSVTKNGKDFTWNRGKKLPIGELASYLNKNLLQHLKNECKGLQTLLKNHHFIFEVSQGSVQFRSPESMLGLCKKFLETQTESKWKLRKCWFFHNHPDKCPLNDDVCSYSHD